MYIVEIIGEKIVSNLYLSHRRKLLEREREVTKEIHDSIKYLPAEYEEVNGEIVGIVEQEIPIVEPKPTPEELKIKELETQLAGLQSAMAELTMMLSAPQ